MSESEDKMKLILNESQNTSDDNESSEEAKMK